MKKAVPVYEENAVDDDLLNEGKRNLLDYLQSRGHFDATVEIQKENGPDTLHVIYHIDPGPVHKLALVEITGQQVFLSTLLRQRPTCRSNPRAAFSHGRYSEALC